MKRMKIVETPSTVREVVDYTTCDLCRQRIAEEGSFEINEIEVSHKTGCRYPDNGEEEEVSVDLCGPCFDTKLIPWLQSQGAVPQISKRDW